MVGVMGIQPFMSAAVNMIRERLLAVVNALGAMLEMNVRPMNAVYHVLMGVRLNEIEIENRH